MEKRTYENDELCQMSYQELRRISILLRLPANIKKKHMISMIEAHQKGDGQTKTEIANKVLQERTLKRLNTQVKRAKPFILSSRVRTNQVSTDLSVATKHEFETRYSYVAHYTKSNKGSTIIKEEAEVSRRNRRVVQQSRKSTRKLAAVEKTEIVLPRNHSLTKVIQLKPDYERNFMSPCKATRLLTSETNWDTSVNYDSVSNAPSVSEYHYQRGNASLCSNLSFPPEYGNSFISSSSYGLHRGLSLRHPAGNLYFQRELYNSVVPGNFVFPDIPKLLYSEVVASHSNSVSMPSSAASFSQRQCESLIRCNGSDEDMFTSELNVGPLGGCNSGDISIYSGYAAKSEMETSEGNYDYSKRFDSLRHGENLHNESLTYLVDVFAPRSISQSPNQIYSRNDVRTDFKDSGFVNELGCYPSIKPRSNEEIYNDGLDAYNGNNGISDGTSEISQFEEREEFISETIATRKIENYILEDRENSMLAEKRIEFEKESREESYDEIPYNTMYRYQFHQPQELAPLPSFKSAFHDLRSPENFISEICIDSSRMSPNELDRSNEKIHKNALALTTSTFSQCRYISGHNQFPESVGKPYSTSEPIPLIVFNLTNIGQDYLYTICRSNPTETTAVHLKPIMCNRNVNKSELHEERTWNGNEISDSQTVEDVLSNNNFGNLYHHQRSMFYSLPEDHLPYSVDSTRGSNWCDYNENLGDKLAQNRRGVRLVQCEKHGYHYFYSLPSSQQV